MVITSDKPIVAERPMYFNYRNKWNGGDDVVGAAKPATTFYFAEGTTRDNPTDGSFEEWICIQNPQTTDAAVAITYWTASAGNQTTFSGSTKILKQYTVLDNTAKSATDGTTPFTFNARPGEFYKLYGKALLIVLAMVAVVAILTASTAGMLKASVSPEGGANMAAVVLPIVMGVFMMAVYNNTRLEGHGLRSTLRARDLFMLYFTNTLGIVFTLGLFIPWAQVRMARYRAERTQFLPQGDMERFVAASQAKVRSTGEEMGEMFDLGVAI